MKVLPKQIILMASLAMFFIGQATVFYKSPSGSAFIKDGSLHQFEGFYRFPNRVAYIQFEVINGKLQARQAWDGRTYLLSATGPLTFESVQEQYKLEFDTVPPSTVKILGRVTLTKVDFDPNQRQSLAPALAASYAGRYRFQRDQAEFIDVLFKDGKLVLVQAWDKKNISLDCITDREFVNETESMPVTFEISSSGAVSMRCFEEDMWIKENESI